MKLTEEEVQALLAAVKKLVEAKGRFHTEQNYAALVALYQALTKEKK